MSSEISAKVISDTSFVRRSKRFGRNWKTVDKGKARAKTWKSPVVVVLSANAVALLKEIAVTRRGRSASVIMANDLP